MIEAQKRYMTDPLYHSVVCYMTSILEHYQITPNEMVEAAKLSGLIFEEHRLSMDQCAEPPATERKS